MVLSILLKKKPAKPKNFPTKISFDISRRFQFFLFLLYSGCVAELLFQERASTVVPLLRSKNHVFPTRGTHPSQLVLGFQKFRSLSHISNTSNKHSEFSQLGIFSNSIRNPQNITPNLFNLTGNFSRSIQLSPTRKTTYYFSYIGRTYCKTAEFIMAYRSRKWLTKI